MKITRKWLRAKIAFPIYASVLLRGSELALDAILNRLPGILLQLIPPLEE